MKQTKKTLYLYSLMFSLLMMLWSSCTSSEQNISSSKSQENEAASNSTSAPSPLKLTDKSSNVLFSWFEDGKAQTTSKIDDIPQNVRKEVRIQYLTIPPEERNPAWIFLANLNSKQKNGTYKVTAVLREKYEAKRHPEPTQKQINEANTSASTVDVIMYVTPYCPHCKTARNWLLKQKIPYKEVNLNEDQKAAAQLAQKGQAQGVPTNGVPIFEINGRLIPGFDAASIKRAMAEPPLGKKSPASPPAKPLPSNAPQKTITI